MTQALALRSLLEESGHRVCRILLGRSRGRDVPEFFLRNAGAPVDYLDSPNFIYDAQYRSVRPLGTLLHAVRHAGRYRDSLRLIDDHVRRDRPDVVINFFEPLAGLYYALYRPTTPMVCIAHQYLFLHPAFQFPPGHTVQRVLLRRFTRLTSIGATRRLALSFYPVPDRPERRLHVVPPLLRPTVFRRRSSSDHPFFLVYLLNHGYAEEIIRWHQKNPDVVLHCFWDRPGAAPSEPFDATLTFHRLDDTRFLDLMARCSGMVTTAGFESVSEAMFFGKPVMMVPVDGHFEQYCNALDAASAGAGIYSRRFDIDRLIDFLPAYASPSARFHAWVGQARSRFVREIKEATGITADAECLPAPDLVAA